MERIILESPYKGNIKANKLYCQFCMRECLLDYNEAPFASHILYTQDNILDDCSYKERMLGIDAGLMWGEAAARTVVYVDLGISSGMCYGIEHAEDVERPVVFRNLTSTRWESFVRICKPLGIPKHPMFNASSPESDELLRAYAHATLALVRTSSGKI